MSQVNIDELLVLGAIGGYSNSVELSETVAAFLITAAAVFFDTQLWYSDAGELNENDIDIIDELLSLATFELTREVNVSIPIGGTIAWHTDDIPQGWLVCNGQTVDQDDYPELYTTLTGNAPSGGTFNLPNLGNRVLFGASVAKPLGSRGGSNEVTLSSFQLPQHDHEYSYRQIRSLGVQPGGTQIFDVPYGLTGAPTTTTPPTPPIPVNVTNQYQAVNWIIRAE